MRPFFQFLISVYFWVLTALFALWTIFLEFVLWIFLRPFGTKLKLMHWVASLWAAGSVWANPMWKVRIHDRHKLQTGKTYVIVANHQSFLDILVLFMLFFHFKWVSKQEVFKIPLMGWAMSLNRYVPIKRGNKESINEMFRKCEEVLANDTSIMMFPEGTRSEDGNPKAFKDGAFVLAERMKVPIIPIVLEGTAQSLPKKGFIIRNRATIHIHVMDEIPVSIYKNMSVTELRDYTRSLMINKLKNIRGQV